MAAGYYQYINGFTDHSINFIDICNTLLVSYFWTVWGGHRYLTFSRSFQYIKKYANEK